MDRGIPERRLAAILIADIVDYSRLMGEDEVRTLAALAELRSDLFEPVVTARDGKVIKRMGDGWIVEYPNISDATACAIEIQERLQDHEIIRLRIGVHIGDVTFQDDDIFGDGINIAARLEALAEPGQVLISDTAQQSLDGKAATRFDGGELHTLKNIARSVAVWRWPTGGKVIAPGPSDKTLSDKPSIAVLPFDNMSGDPDQEYFSDGIAEDIITELSRYHSLFVIARNSSFSYKGKTVDIIQVGKELGAHYVMEGSVRKVGNRVRITVQLIDTTNGHHIWAERYDNDLDDIFQVQDTVTQSIVATLPGQLDAAGLEGARRKPTENLAAYEFVLRGRDHHHRITKHDNSKAMQFINLALDKDPEYSEAYSWRACTIGQAIARGYREWSEDLREEALKDALHALEIDENDAEAHRIMCRIRLQFKQFDQSEFHLQRALTLTPNDPRIIAQKGINLTWCGDPDTAITWITEAIRRDPNHEDAYSFDLGCALFVSKRYDDALTAFKSTGTPTYQHHAFLAACAVQVGNVEEAARHASSLLQAKSDFSIDEYLKTLPYKNESDLMRHRELLIKAGLPE